MSLKAKAKWIVVDNDVYQRLKDLGRKGETFNDIVRKLLETYELRATRRRDRLGHALDICRQPYALGPLSSFTISIVDDKQKREEIRAWRIRS